MNHDAAVFNAEAGCFISLKMERLAEIIKDFDPYLELKWIPPSARDSSDSMPYAVVASHPANAPYVLLRFGETEEPEEVLARIFMGDNTRNNVLDTVDAHNAAKEAFRLKERLDAMYEMHDKFHFLATSRSPNFVNWGKDEETGKKIRLDSNRRRI
jgi:hypothetical protein